jgi:signal peptidase I
MMTTEKKAISFIKELFQWIQAIALAVVIALLIRGFLFEPVYVDGESMENTLISGQRLLVYKLGYYFNEPKNGDIIVLRYQEGAGKDAFLLKKLPFLKKIIPDFQEIDFVKRVIGVPGDIVDIKNGFVYVNGEKLIEPYAKGATYTQHVEFPIMIPENKVLVLGDNRLNSRDSRHIGLIDYNQIKGKAVFRIWPFIDIGLIE